MNVKTAHKGYPKEELLAEVARQLLAEVGPEQEHWSSDWETRMVELSCATRRVARDERAGGSPGARHTTHMSVW